MVFDGLLFLCFSLSFLHSSFIYFSSVEIRHDLCRRLVSGETKLM